MFTQAPVNRKKQQTVNFVKKWVRLFLFVMLICLKNMIFLRFFMPWAVTALNIYYDTI